jgi:hypothetical protein
VGQQPVDLAIGPMELEVEGVEQLEEPGTVTTTP